MPLSAAEMKKALKRKEHENGHLGKDFFDSLSEPSPAKSMQQDAPYAPFRAGRGRMSNSWFATIPGMDKKEQAERESEIAGLREFGGILSDEEYEARRRHIYRPSRNASKK